jgi:hypothetical protein
MRGPSWSLVMGVQWEKEDKDAGRRAIESGEGE